MKWYIARRQGISAAVGMALAGKIDKKDYRVYAVLGDGEIQEGQVWESAMAAGHHDGSLKLIAEMEDAMLRDAVALYRTAADKQKRRRISLWNVWIRECRSC